MITASACAESCIALWATPLRASARGSRAFLSIGIFLGRSLSTRSWASVRPMVFTLARDGCVEAQARGMEQRVEVPTVDDQSRMNSCEVGLEQVLCTDSSVVNGEVVALRALGRKPLSFRA